MADLLYLALGIGFFAATVGARLRVRPAGRRLMNTLYVIARPRRARACSSTSSGRCSSRRTSRDRNLLIQCGLYVVVLLALAKPLGAYMARVYEGERTFLHAGARLARAR